MPRCQSLVKAKQKLSELQLFIKLTSRAETAAQGRLEEQLSEATVLIAVLRSELETLAAVGSLSRKQSAASAAQAKST